MFLDFYWGRMAEKMVLVFFSFLLAIIGVNAHGELDILHSPDSLKFTGSSKVHENIVQEIFSATLGLSVDENSDWNGLAITDPFNTPEAVVEIRVNGGNDVIESAVLKTKSYELVVDPSHPDSYEILSHRIKQRYVNGPNKIVDFNLADVNTALYQLGSTKKVNLHKINQEHLHHLRVDTDEDRQFLLELAALKAIVDQVNSGTIVPDNAVDFYRIKISSLHPLVDYHGPYSLQAKEAKNMLASALESLKSAFVKAYNGSVVVAVVSTDTKHSHRPKRQAPEEQTPEEQTPEGQAEEPPATGDHEMDNYSEDYAAIFNIILWFGVVFTFSLIAIVYALMDMDPGRDSIIYRMTNPKMKKDN